MDKLFKPSASMTIPFKYLKWLDIFFSKKSTDAWVALFDSIPQPINNEFILFLFSNKYLMLSFDINSLLLLLIVSKVASGILPAITS